MPAFDQILEAARRRVGAAELRARMPAVSAAHELRAVADDRYLSMTSRWIFHGFDLRCVRAHPRQLSADDGYWHISSVYRSRRDDRAAG
jgi:hypothetical protein